ncbi:MAG: hypothetical protein ACKOZT_07365 [Cyanobium sp.]
MAYPTSHASGSGFGQTFTQGNNHPLASVRLAAGGSIGVPHPPRAPFTGSNEGEHQLEKLEFALAVALTRGDQQRSQQLRQAIAELGGNQEEPGT